MSQEGSATGSQAITGEHLPVHSTANDRVIFVCSDVLLALQIVAMIEEDMTDMDSFLIVSY